MFRATLESVLLSILGFALTSPECFHSSVVEPPVHCTLEHRARCGADRRTNTGRWPNDSLVPNKIYHSNNRTFELTWEFRNGIGTNYLNHLEGIQIKIDIRGTVRWSLYPESCERMVFNASEHQVNGAEKQRRLLNSQFHYTINCSDSSNVGKIMTISLSLLPLQLYEQQTPITVSIECPPTPTTPSAQPDILLRMLNDFVTGTATENDLSFQGDGSLSIPFYNRFQQYAHYKVGLVAMKLLKNGYSAYNFYGEFISGCSIYKVDIQVEVSYPCDDFFKFLKPYDKYQILIKIYDADLNVVLVGTKRTQASRRIPVSINADMYEHHVTAENITIEQSGEGFNVTFPIAPRHIDMPNRFDIQIPSKRITLLNITRSEVASLNYHWKNYTYAVDQIKVSAGERITISLIVWNKDGSNLILEKNYMFPQKPTTRTASSSTLKMDLKLIIGMFGLIYM